VVRWTTEEATTNALHTISSQVNTRNVSGGVPVMVVNPLAWSRTDLATFDVQMPTAPKAGLTVLDLQGKPLPFQVLSKDSSTRTYRLLVELKDVPSLGYGVVHIVPGDKSAPTDLKASGLTLENSQLRLTVDAKTGCITSLRHKAANFESIASGGCGNQLQAFQDTPKDYDAWNIDAGFEKQVTMLD